MEVGVVQKKKALKGSLRGLFKGNKVENPILMLAEPSDDTAWLVGGKTTTAVCRFRRKFCSKPRHYLTMVLHYNS